MRPPIWRLSVQPAKESTVTSDQDRDARRRLGASRSWTAQELAAIRELGRQWRDAWRAEKTTPAEKPNGPAADSTPAQPERKAIVGADFAAGIARAEFGRFYWNERLDGQLKAAMTRRPRRDGNKRGGKTRG
jgi:hypothetical protein